MLFYGQFKDTVAECIAMPFMRHGGTELEDYSQELKALLPLAYEKYLEEAKRGSERSDEEMARGAIRVMVGNLTGEQYINPNAPSAIERVEGCYGTKFGSGASESERIELFKNTICPLLHDEPQYSAYQKLYDAVKHFPEFWEEYTKEGQKKNRDRSTHPYIAAIQSFGDYADRWHYHEKAKRPEKDIGR